jgi:hypothetical protein
LDPVYNPWFSANGTYNITHPELTLILADTYVNTMVYADQFVMCNPSTSSCTSPGGIQNLLVNLEKNLPRFNAVQLSTVMRIFVSLTDSHTGDTVDSFGTAALWASNIVGVNFSPGLPDNQWQIEVLGWFQTNLAKLQASVVDFVSQLYGWDSVPRMARQADNKLHLVRMASTGTADDGNDWELGRCNIPIRDDEAQFNRPTTAKGLVAYGNG